MNEDEEDFLAELRFILSKGFVVQRHWIVEGGDGLEGNDELNIELLTSHGKPRERWISSENKEFFIKANELLNK